MKLHSVFTKELIHYLNVRMPNLGEKFNLDTAMEIVGMSRMGVLPEGSDFITEPKLVGIPIPPPPIDETQNMEAVALKQKFAFGKTSLERLNHVKKELRDMALLAISFGMIDMTIVQTIRSAAEQKRNVANGVSRTLHSKHLPDETGLARAMDVAAFVNGKISWEPEHYADIAWAMDRAATQLGFAEHIRWGGAWDRVLSDFGGTHEAYLDEVNKYAKRHAGSDLIDMPHFEWVA